MFAKPLVPKQFRAGVWRTAQDLGAECAGLVTETDIITSGVVAIRAEARAWIVHGEVATCAVYDGDAKASARTGTSISTTAPAAWSHPSLAPRRHLGRSRKDPVPNARRKRLPRRPASRPGSGGPVAALRAVVREAADELRAEQRDGRPGRRAEQWMSSVRTGG